MSAIFRTIPALHLYTAALMLLLIGLQSLLRVVFWLLFETGADPVAGGDLALAFYLGMKYDMQVATGVALPVLLLGWIKWLHPVYQPRARRFWLLCFGLVVAALLAFFALDFGHYAYLQQRINATALRFLDDLGISATMAWQTYPVIQGSLLILAATVFMVWCLHRITCTLHRFASRTGLQAKTGARPWYIKTAIVTVTFFLILGGFMAKISWYPLRWSDAFFSPQHFSAQLASNPVIYFSNTLKNVDESYQRDAVVDAYPLMADYLGIRQGEVETLDFRRHADYTPLPAPPVNVVAVFLESFASYKSSLSGNPLKTTPHIDWLAANGYYFKNYFTPTTGTARSVWTLVTGIPDVEKNKTSSRNPLIVRQHTLINDFQGYEKFYFLGGSASWANIRGFLAGNIDDLHIYEEGSYESPAIDVWGISDLDLFKEANQVLARQDKPFFAIIQTSGNHRPYTIPEDNDGFRVWNEDDLLIDGVQHDVTDYGFASLEEMNSFRFMDHAVGRFIELARQQPYFDDTLFVFYGDHGIHAPTGDHTDHSDEKLALQGLRVPLIFFSPRLIDQPRTLDTVAGEVDVLPTIAALTHTPHDNTTLGRDLFDPRFDDSRYAFTLQPDVPRVLGLVSDRFYLQMKTDGSGKRLQRLGSPTPRKDLSARYPEETRTMSDYLMAMWHTMRYIRENNPSHRQTGIISRPANQTDSESK